MDDSSSPSSLLQSPEGLKPFACTICAQRKVRCDKRHPCSACLKTRLNCVYRTEQTVPRKRRRQSSSQSLRENLRHHEPSMRATKVPLADVNHPGSAVDNRNGDTGFGEQIRLPTLPSGPPQSHAVAITTTTRLPHRKILVPENGGLRYYEHGFIGIMGQQYRQGLITGSTCDNVADGAQQAAPEELASTMFTGLPSPVANPLYRQIPHATGVRYWQTFINNVHPLTKIVHPPTEYQYLIEGSPDHSITNDALRYSIYGCAVASLTEKECLAMFGESQASLLSEFQSATRHKLLEASFLRVPDSSLLRAQVLLLTSMLRNSDSSSLWILMGSVMRMAQSQGLHRDGLGLGLSPFHAEMRRRLWWYIVTLDGRLTELTGSENTVPKFMDTCLPLNLNDNDLDPAMKTSPQERVGSSEMTFCLVHYEAARFLAEYDPRYDESEPRLSSRLGGPRDCRSASELESYLEERSNLCKFKQMEHRRLYQPDPDDNNHNTATARTNPFSTTNTNNNTTLNVAVRNIEYDNLIHSSRSLRGFLWHVNFYFPWGAPIFILKDLAFHPDWDADMLQAWERIEELHEHHPEYKDTSKDQHLIIGGLTIKAWLAREAVLLAKGVPKQQQMTPTIIQELQVQQAAFLTRRQYESRVVSAARTPNNDNTINSIYTAPYDFDFTNFDLMDPMFADVDWSGWNGY